MRIAVAPPLSTPATVTALLSLSAVVLQVMLLGIALRTYRHQRTQPLQFITWACACYIVPHVVEYLIFFIPGFLYPQHGRPIASWWLGPLDQISLILFVVLMIFAFKSFDDERTDRGDPRI